MDHSIEMCLGDLDALKRYLALEHGMGKVVRGIRLRHDADADGFNRKNPRSFGYTIKGSKVIRCASALEWAGPRARIGVILHEILHIALNAFDGDAEIKVDEFATSELGEIGYHYADLSYTSGWSGQVRHYRAKAIEQVPMEFVRKLEKYRR